jgi:hypothetical protein
MLKHPQWYDKKKLKSQIIKETQITTVSYNSLYIGRSDEKGRW